MKTLRDMCEGILGPDLDTKIDKMFPPEIDEMIKLWDKIELYPRQSGTASHVLERPSQAKELRSSLDGRACKAYKKAFDLLKKCDCERVSKSEAQNYAKRGDDVVIINAEDPHVGIYICNAKTEECLRIIEDETYDRDRHRMCRAVFVNPTHRSSLWHSFTKSSEPYMIVSGALWEPLKKALSVK